MITLVVTKGYNCRSVGTWRKAAVLTSGVLLSFSMTGLQAVNADWTEPNGGAVVDNEQLVTSAVPTQLWCTWYVNGVEDISLQPQIVDTVDGLPVFAEYEGADMLLSTNQNQEILLAGWTESGKPTVADRFSGVDNFDCDWYVNEVGITVNVDSADTARFSAAAGGVPDTEMGWPLSAKSLIVSYAENTEYETNNCENWVPGLLPQVFDGTYTGGQVLRKNAGDASTSSYCAITATFEVTMPGGMAPTFAGQDYTFTGPTLTTKVAFIVD